MEILSTTFSTIESILKTLEGIQSAGKGKLIVFIDDGCGHPYFFSGTIKVSDGFATFSGVNDANFNKWDHLATVDEIITNIKDLDKNLKCIAECGCCYEEYHSFDGGEASDFIDISDMDEDVFNECFAIMDEYVNFDLMGI